MGQRPKQKVCEAAGWLVAELWLQKHILFSFVEKHWIPHTQPWQKSADPISMSLPKQADRGTAERWVSRELLEDKTTAILWLQSCPLNNLTNTTHKYSVTMAGRLGAPGSHYPGVLWAPVSWEGCFHTDQREGKAHCPAADRPRRLEQTGCCFRSSHHPQDPSCLVLGYGEERIRNDCFMSKAFGDGGKEKTSNWWELQNSVNGLEATELYTLKSLKWWILRYENFTLGKKKGLCWASPVVQW